MSAAPSRLFTIHRGLTAGRSDSTIVNHCKYTANCKTVGPTILLPRHETFDHNQDGIKLICDRKHDAHDIVELAFDSLEEARAMTLATNKMFQFKPCPEVCNKIFKALCRRREFVLLFLVWSIAPLSDENP